MTFNPFLELRHRHGKEFRIILNGDFEYNKAREISNSYFDRKPLAVAFPRTAEQVRACILYCKEKGEQFRTRSGGHHHEGMSSSDDVLVIRMSDMDLIEYLPKTDADGATAWIGPGLKLGSVYDELAKKGYILPAGGCFSVNVGGLTLGGGWGMHSRMYGLTCDSMLAVEMVEANGDIIEVTPKSKSKSEKELFRALCGGGQGNFGIVTRFKFKLTKIGENQTWFRFGWNADKREQVAEAWLEVQSKFPSSVTSFVRMAVIKPGEKIIVTEENKDKVRARDFAIYGGGLFYGTEKDLKNLEAMEELISRAKPDLMEYDPVKVKSRPGIVGGKAGATEINITDLFGYDEFTMGLTESQDAVQNAENCNLPAPPSVNCDAPHPHKVSSAFPKGKDQHKQMAKSVANYLDHSVYDPEVRSYMTFHAMGGAISKEPTIGRAFPYAEKEYLLQFQSWWNHPKSIDENCKVSIANKEKVFRDWVINFRAALANENLVEGAFINFVDKDLPHDKDNRKELLAYYFGNEEKLNRLIKVKKNVDPKDQFNFEMSIPIK